MAAAVFGPAFRTQRSDKLSRENARRYLNVQPEAFASRVAEPPAVLPLDSADKRNTLGAIAADSGNPRGGANRQSAGRSQASPAPQARRAPGGRPDARRLRRQISE